MKFSSRLALIICSVVILFCGLLAYPKYKKANTEATLSWDVSGYYFYLPAIFIYKDLKQLKFKDDILKKYGSTPHFNQGYLHESGNHVLKYSSGLAIQYLPGFLVAHTIASFSSYEADGFSLPYQLAISLWSLIVAIIGLYFLRKVLLHYFSDRITALSLVLIALGTNYLNYAAIDSAMTHNYLFTIYAILMWLCIKFYESPNFTKAIGIGALVGLAALTRPTEIIAAILPLLWGVGSINDLKERLQFVLKNYGYFIAAIIVMGCIGSIQLIYWKYATGDWIVYSYQEQGFSWLRPHFNKGLFSVRKGWLVYTPLMLFALIGFYFLWLENKRLFLPLMGFFGIFIYITFAWDIWWYGGSLGQRAMVQSYAVLAIPLGMFIKWLLDQKMLWKAILFSILAVFVYYNLWLTYQAHGGKLLKPDSMTKAYFFKILGRYQVEETALKLLDTDEEFRGERKQVQELVFEDFEQQTIPEGYPLAAVSGVGAAYLSEDKQYSEPVSAKLPVEGEWIRASADFRCHLKEWDPWRMAQLVVRFFKGEELAKQRSIRIHRFIDNGQMKNIFIDVEIPDDPDLTKVDVRLWNAGGQKNILMDNLKIESFK